MSASDNSTTPGHTHSHSHSHGGVPHSHPVMDDPGEFRLRDVAPTDRDYSSRAFTVGIGGPVGAGKTAILLKLCEHFREKYKIGVVTNDIFTREDADFLIRHEALTPDRIRAVETGGCPHAAIREDISLNIAALAELMEQDIAKTQLLFVESGGDNLAANFSRELADFIVYVIDVSGGDKIPRKGGPGITQGDLLVINKKDLAEIVGANLDIMARDSALMRGEGPFLFTNAKSGDGIAEIATYIEKAIIQADAL